MQPGEVVERVPARPPSRAPSFGDAAVARLPDPFEGTSEALTITPEGEAFLDRHDVWGPPNKRPPQLRFNG